MSRQLLLLFAKLAVAAALLLLVLRMVELGQLATVFGSANLYLIGTSFALLLGRLPLMGVRWRLILEQNGYKLTTGYLTKVSMVSMFFSLFLPTVSGGDIVRGFYLTRQRVLLRHAITSVLCDRGLGVFTLLVLAVFPAIFIGFWRPELWKIPVGVVGLAALVLIGSFLLWRMVNLDYKLLQKSNYWRSVVESLRTSVSDIVGLIRNRVLVGRLLALTLLLHLAGIVSVYVAGRALGSEVGFVFYVVFVPVIWLITMLPISIGGLGVREGAFVVLFSQVGMTTELAFAVALVVLVLSLGQGALGGIVFALDRLGATSTEQKVKLG